MKKTIALLLVILMAATLVGCRKTLKSDADFIRKAREVMPIENADRAVMQYAGCIRGSSTAALHWVVSGDEHENHTYLPMACERVGPAWKYTYSRSYQAIICMKDVAMLEWDGRVVFCINNTDVRGMRWTDADGTEHYNSYEQIPYSAYPFLREYDAGCTAFTFLDAEGSELLTVTVSD